MKKLLLAFLALAPLGSFAQNYNPFLTQGIISPAPLQSVESNGTGNAGFIFGNSGTDSMPLSNGGPIVIKVVFSRGIPDNANPLNAISGTIASKFTWTYDAASKTYTGTQNQTILGATAPTYDQGVGTVNIAYRVDTNSVSTQPQNGFKVNILPPAYATSNTTGDDLVSSYTWTVFKVSGNVYNDLDGMIDGVVDGTGTNGGGLYVSLVNASNQVVKFATVNADGSFEITGANPGTYTVRLSTTLPTVGAAAPPVVLPSTFVSTGESIPSTPAGDGTPNGTIGITLGAADFTGIKFGINKPPTAAGVNMASQTNPGGTISAPVTATSFTGTDPDGGTVVSMTIPTFPTNATSITVGTTTYYPTAAAIPSGCSTCQAFPGGGITNIPTNASGNPTQPISVDPVAGAVTVNIPFNVKDNAGLTSGNSSVDVPFAIGYAVSGTVFNDNNGVTGNADAGASGNTYISGGLNAVLVSGGVVKAQSAISTSNGTYSFTDVPAASYTVILTTSSYSVGAAAPTVSTLPGIYKNVSSSDNITPTDGMTSFTLSTASVSGVNFGINQPPTAAAFAAASQPNPGGTVSIPVPGFGGTDLTLGIISSLTITAFPINATSITIGTNTYDATTFPTATGLVIPTNSAGVPTSAVSVDPIAGTTTVTITYKVKDNASLESTTANITMPFSIGAAVSGTVYVDNNATTEGVNAGANGSTYTGGGLNAILVNSSNNVVAVTPVSTTNGTYSFADVPNGAYTVVLSTASPVAGTTAPAGSTLPSTFVNVSSTDATPADGITAVTVASNANVTNVNFGINQPPTANTATLASQVNPGGTVSVPVASSNFTGSDPTNGIIVSMNIPTFPTNATSITIGTTTYYPSAAAIPSGCSTCQVFPAGGVTISTNASGNPTSAISVDPVAGNVTVAISFTVTDNAGLVSTPANVNVPFTTGAGISGIVYVDNDGTVGGANAGAGGAVYTGGNLNAILLNGTTVAGVTPISTSNGTYNFADLPNATYVVMLSTSNPAVGSTIATPTSALPGTFVNVSSTDATPTDGKTTVGLSGSSVSNINFGINQPPAATPTNLTSQPNPGGNVCVSVPAANFGGTDQTGGIINSMTITAFPTNATSITIGSTTYYASSATLPSGCSSCQVFPVAGVSIATNAVGQPSQSVCVDPSPGTVTVGITYTVTDNAGLTSPPATLNVPFSAGSVLSGTVFNDNDGMDNGANAGAGGSNYTSGNLYAVLVNGSTVVASTAISTTNGQYSFSDLTTANYTVILSTTSYAAGAVAPTTATLPGVYQNVSSVDATPLDGMLSVAIVAGTSQTGRNFGINQPPTATGTNQNAQLNPGGTTFVTVPASSFAGSDLTGGIIDSLLITAFPTGTTSITIGSITYTSATFPGNGVMVATNSTGQPIPVISVDPNNGIANVQISFKVIDNANLSSNTATVLMPFRVPDLTPVITGTPSNLSGLASLGITVTVSELLNFATEGTITVLVAKDSRINFSYDNTLTTIGATPVQNSSWNYFGGNQFFHIFTTNASITGLGNLSFGMNATFNPDNTDGHATLTSTIVSGSGREVYTANNGDSDILIYFHQ